MMNENTLRRLETQLEVIPILLAGASEESIVARPVSGQWSARENLAHLARYHAVFLERLRRILEEDSPDLGRYRAEEDPAWPEWSGLSLDEILARLKALRPEIVDLVMGLSDEEINRTGVHPLLGEMSLSRWMEFFLLHEAHHLYVVMLRLGHPKLQPK
jgi:uncharacterized damage-inducible protein DinB